MSTRSQRVPIALIILIFYNYIFGCRTQNMRQFTNTTNVTVEKTTNDGKTISITSTVEKSHIGDTIGEKILQNRFRDTLRKHKGSIEPAFIGSTQTELRNYDVEEVHTDTDSYIPIILPKTTHRTFDTEKTRCVRAISDTIQTLTLPGGPSFNVRCIVDENGKCPWAVILERKSQRDNFDFGWLNYRAGFGDPATGNGYFRFEGEDLVKEIYGNFRIGDESVDYAVVSLSVNTNNTMIRHLQIASKFITKDRHFDERLAVCARTLGMGWWYSEKCLQSMMLHSVRAYVKAPTIIAVRPINCEFF
ncbi:PREDICTED: fibrinogen alpha chain-like isoform X2 [Bactrocera latifrons]|uniref:fibrinogen alpha chain-like isoform X2 n=1 Tax=Bactrocera latifrons TaxID=174628 RepID=UPI0008DC5DBC|nr:PREDICTED: fibrinogen alpha chain-like isoform X2 [Bactrocera latifrons]